MIPQKVKKNSVSHHEILSRGDVTTPLQYLVRIGIPSDQAISYICNVRYPDSYHWFVLYGAEYIIHRLSLFAIEKEQHDTMRIASTLPLLSPPRCVVIKFAIVKDNLVLNVIDLLFLISILSSIEGILRLTSCRYLFWLAIAHLIRYFPLDSILRTVDCYFFLIFLSQSFFFSFLFFYSFLFFSFILFFYSFLSIMYWFVVHESVLRSKCIVGRFNESLWIHHL